MLSHLRCGVLISQTTQLHPASAHTFTLTIDLHAGEIITVHYIYHSSAKATKFDKSIEENHQVVINDF